MSDSVGSIQRVMAGAEWLDTVYPEWVGMSDLNELGDIPLYGPEDAEWIAQGEVFTKKPNGVHMRKLDYEFAVATNEGTMLGHPGDWLCYDRLSGHVWVISNDYKEMHYV